MSVSKPIRILIIGALCVAALIALVVRESVARASGTEIILRMEAVDPRALLQGHYVVLNFQEQLAQGKPCPPIADPEGPDRAWVAFAHAGDRHRVAGAAATRADAARHAPLVVRGAAYCQPPRAPEDEDSGAPGFVSADIGIDRFYINQGQAKRIERLLIDQRGAGAQPVSAIVSIGSDGRARLKGLLVEGQRLELNW